MSIFTIKKMSGDGSIHDLASEHHDRVIDFKDIYKYAIILPAYFGGRGYTCHTSAKYALRAYNILSRVNYTSHVIIDRQGNLVQYHDLCDEVTK